MLAQWKEKHTKKVNFAVLTQIVEKYFLNQKSLSTMSVHLAKH